MTCRNLGSLLLAASFLSASPAETIYAQKCASCHGSNGEQKAMGKSKAISEMSVEEIEKAMADIASGERKSMEFVKNAKDEFIKKHSKEELHQLAAYIDGLK